MPVDAPTRATVEHPPVPVPDPVQEAARLYASDTPAAQAALARAAQAALAASGTPARLGSYGPHVTVEADAPGGSVVLVPLADLEELDADLAVEDDRDPAVWHVMARNAEGQLLADPRPAYGCPSVLWVLRAGIEPSCAVWLLAAAVADAAVLQTLRWQVTA